ncbi:DASH complex subunit DAD2 [Rhodotorula paludigena]|uniref:DASH complex subunit DAD2 n=1 Tax=Rhodotorula paludigena TaxID=86838 RepID=UPI00316C1432
MYPRASLHPAPPGTLTPAHSRLADKQREYTAFAAIAAHAHALARFLDDYADRYDTLDGGSEAVGDVVEHWQNVFRVTGLALASLAEQRAAHAPSAPAENPQEGADHPVVALPPGALPAKLVRIPVRHNDDDGSSAAAAGAEGAARGSGAQTPTQV